jgi:hypothetical protein
MGPKRYLDVLIRSFAPSRGAKILLGVAAVLVVAGLAVMVIPLHTYPLDVPLVFVGAALTVPAGLIWFGLCVGAYRRQGKAPREGLR